MRKNTNISWKKTHKIGLVKLFKVFIIIIIIIIKVKEICEDLFGNTFFFFFFAKM
jgi:hypothetical protein